MVLRKGDIVRISIYEDMQVPYGINQTMLMVSGVMARVTSVQTVEDYGVPPFQRIELESLKEGSEREREDDIFIRFSWNNLMVTRIDNDMASVTENTDKGRIIASFI